MKITDVEFGMGKKYVDENGNSWFAGMFELESLTCESLKINDVYYLPRILTLEFEEVVDWSKVEVDTPILVKKTGGKDWEKRHFASFDDKKVFAFQKGKTSWTNEGELLLSWDCVKLGDVK